MPTNKKVLFVFMSTILVLILGTTIVMSREGLQDAYEKLKQEFIQESKEYNEPDSEYAGNEEELKRKAGELGKMEATLYPKTAEEILAGKIFTAKSVLEDFKVVYNKDDPKDAEKLNRLNEKLKMLDEIENDLKDGKENILVLQRRFNEVEKIKLR